MAKEVRAWTLCVTCMCWREHGRKTRNARSVYVVASVSILLTQIVRFSPTSYLDVLPPPPYP